MKILALEFSSTQRSVAVAATDARFSAQETEVVETGERATQAIGLIEAALRAARLEREQIDCLAVGIGPGSYTGIRAAISLAQGWQLARDVKLLGVSSVECLAAQAQSDGFRGELSVVIDAQRNEFYIAGYDITEQRVHEIERLRLVSEAEVKTLQQQGRVLAGPDAALRFPGSRASFPRAATLARLALGRKDFVAGEALEPIYLRETSFVKAPPPREIPF